MKTHVLFRTFVFSLLIHLFPLVASAQIPPPAMQIAQSVWKQFASTEGGFTVLFPGIPQEAAVPLNTPSGQVSLRIFAADRPGQAAYFVSYADFPAAVLRYDPNTLLNGVVNGAVRNVQGTILSQQAINVAGFPGRETRVQAAGGKILRYRTFLVNQRLYQIVVETTPGAEMNLTGSIQGFFNSFKLLAR
ncbi:MAG: hypothetical protein VKL59_11325 [Nostocaceae cyanobacterium]|nr:hypothetical protein [Nostocaceae cyanobacterium]